ncbi:MAG: Npt1/Npt2 family nucleotide transporter, partial [Bryobacteraceae bacterium]
LLLNVVNTSGEFLISSLVTEQAARAVGAGPEFEEARRRFIGAFFGDYFFWVNTLGFLFQAFLVSRLFRYIGVGGALFILPAIAFTGYVLLLAAPVLGVIRLLKIIENSADYSIQNTARQALFLPTAREVKYKAKAAIDTFFHRAGDVAQAAIVYAGTHFLSLGIQGFAMLNLFLTGVWLVLVMYLAREYRRRSQSAAAPSPAA